VSHENLSAVKGMTHPVHEERILLKVVLK